MNFFFSHVFILFFNFIRPFALTLILIIFIFIFYFFCFKPVGGFLVVTGERKRKSMDLEDVKRRE